MIIQAERIILRPWRETDRAPLAAMLADPVVMHDYPAPFTRAQSDAQLDRYAEAFGRLGYSRMAVQHRDGGFLGYVGIMPIHERHAEVGPGAEIGWRLASGAWGKGYATEAARAVLKDGYERRGFEEVMCYTEPSNLRSQAVMRRLGMTREPQRDFSYSHEGVSHANVVFVARPSDLAA